MRLLKCVHYETFKIPDDEIRNTYKESICVLYGFDTYRCDLVHISELKNAILNDYPNIKDTDIAVWYVLPHESDRHARFTMLRIMIPVEDFVELRANREIDIL